MFFDSPACMRAWIVRAHTGTHLDGRLHAALQVQLHLGNVLLCATARLRQAGHGQRRCFLKVQGTGTAVHGARALERWYVDDNDDGCMHAPPQPRPRASCPVSGRLRAECRQAPAQQRVPSCLHARMSNACRAQSEPAGIHGRCACVAAAVLAPMRHAPVQCSRCARTRTAGGTYSSVRQYCLMAALYMDSVNIGDTAYWLPPARTHAHAPTRTPAVSCMEVKSCCLAWLAALLISQPIGASALLRM